MYIKGTIITKESSVSLTNRINKKNFSLQFLPECLYNITDSKVIIYKERKLKTSYLIDITHNLILKYYFKKNNRFVLNATILKDKYGYLYNYYINYLIDNSVISLMSKHLAGVSSRVYSLNKKIFTSEIKRYRNDDKVLLKKFKSKFVNIIHINDTSDDNLICEEVRTKLINDLFDIKIEYDRSLFFLDSLKDKDTDIYNRNVYSVECINDKHIFYHFDNYGRMHTNYTILKSFIRKNCLLIDNEETCEIDIANSQPLFLTKLIIDSDTKWINKDEFELFTYLTINGLYYKYFMYKLEIFDKKAIKELTYKVLFGKNHINSKSDKLFITLFPTIHNFIKLYKKEKGDYRILAYDLQKAESNLIFNKIIKRVIDFNPDIKLLTIHDSIIMQRKYKDIVTKIFEDEINSEFDKSKYLYIDIETTLTT
jgi:hypothetical protein